MPYLSYDGGGMAVWPKATLRAHHFALSRIDSARDREGSGSIRPSTLAWHAKAALVRRSTRAARETDVQRRVLPLRDHMRPVGSCRVYLWQGAPVRASRMRLNRSRSIAGCEASCLSAAESRKSCTCRMKRFAGATRSKTVLECKYDEALQLSHVR